MGSTLRVIEATTPSDLERIIRFPWALYQDDPNWAPPLVSMRRSLFDREHHPAWEYLEGAHFLALRGDTVVGIISAILNHRHNTYNHENVAWFGDFESIDDQAVASALLDTAADWARARGCDVLRGPQTFTTHEMTGLLVENFSLPMIMSQYNAPYYADLIEGAGFARVMDTVSFYQDRDTLAGTGAIERIQRIVDRTQKRSGLVVRPVDSRRKKEEFAIFKQLYNAAWSENWGFVPMTERELDALIADLGLYFDPALAFIAEIHGEPIGFLLAIGNMNEVLKRADPKPGVPEWWTMLRAGWYWKIRPAITGVRLPLMGVTAEHRNKGVELAMFLALFRNMIDSRYEFLDAGWILETNVLVSISLQLGGRIHRRWRYYERPL
jgi:GNAT superfamily N-acetyltransferase